MKYLIATIILTLLSTAVAAKVTKVDIENLRKEGITITGIQFEVGSPEPECEVKYYSQWDVSRDGVFDQLCVGLEYDVCDINGESEAYFEFSVKGGVCKPAEPVEPVVYCDEQVIVVSPTICVER